MKAVRLQTEYLFNPLGLGNTRPRFFWNCEGGVTQTAYRIRVFRGEETLWDTGKRESADMTGVPYEGEALGSRNSLTWSVVLWDENDEEGEPAWASFEMGLLRAEDWQAQWIAGACKPKKGRRYPVDSFRKAFAVSGKVKKARLYASARGVYEVRVNGRPLEDFCLAPGMTDYRKRIQVQTYDVTADIGAENTLELCLADGWYRGSVAAYGVTEVFGNRTSVLAQLELTMEDGSSQVIATDGTWDWSDDGPVRFADLKDGEIVDASMVPSYSRKAQTVPAPKDVLLVPSDNVPVTIHESFEAKLLPGNVLDFGQNIAGFLSFVIRGKKGQQVRIVCGEVLDAAGQVDLSGIQETKPARGWSQFSLIKKLLGMELKGGITHTPKQEIVFTCSGGEDIYRMRFSVFGFRYAQVFGDIEVKPEDFRALAVYSDLEQTGDYTCSNPLVNRLIENTRWSMKGNFLDVPTDCPTRERLGWTGDAQVFFGTGAYFMNVAPFFSKWLRDMEDDVYPNGLVSAVIPYSGVEMMYKATGSSVGWADAVYLIPWRYFERYGDKRILERCWPMAEKYAEYLLANIDRDGHYEKGVHLGEWLEPEEFRDAVYGTKAKHPEECTAYLYLAMTTIARMARELGKPDERYMACAEAAKKAYARYQELDTDRQAKLVRPLALGLLEGETKKTAQQRLKQAAENYRYRVSTGFLSTPFVLPVLTEAGFADTAYRMLENTERPGWLAEVAEGATTIWENWEGNLSRNHYSPGAVCQWLFDTSAGIRVAGERTFTIAPVPGGSLTFAKARYMSPWGEVESGWEKTGDKVRFTVKIPSNCTAEIVLPDGRREEVKTGEYCYE